MPSPRALELAAQLTRNQAIHDVDERSRYTAEELAISQLAQTMASAMAQDGIEGIDSLGDIDEAGIDKMRSLGHLSLVAEHLPPNFLDNLEASLKKHPISFKSSEKDKQDLHTLYQKVKGELDKKGAPYTFGDVLLRMYTADSAFYRKLNAILGKYHQSASKAEQYMSFLMILGIHRAGLDKQQYELQQQPDSVFRGTSFGASKMEEAMQAVTDITAGKGLSALKPADVAAMDTSDLFSKRVLSTSGMQDVAERFVKTSKSTEKFTMEVINPDALGDVYHLSNISEFGSGHPFDEDEYVSRIPNDVRLIPVEKEIRNGMPHFTLVAIRSHSLELNSSLDRLASLQSDLSKAIGDATKSTPSSGFMSYLLPSSPTIHDNRKPILKHLKQLLSQTTQQVIALQGSHPHSTQQEINKHLLGPTLDLLKQLYDIKPPMSAAEKRVIDPIRQKAQKLLAVLARLDTVIESHSHDQFDESRARQESTIVASILRWEHIDQSKIDSFKQAYSACASDDFDAKIKAVNELKVDCFAVDDVRLEHNLDDLISVLEQRKSLANAAKEIDQSLSSTGSSDP